MEIKYKNYVISTTQQGERFNLQEVEKGRKIGTGTPHAPNGAFYDKLIDRGYDYKFEWLCDAIISREISKKVDVTSLDKYLEEYKNERIALESFWSQYKPEPDPNVITITVEEYDKLKTLYDSIHSNEE